MARVGPGRDVNNSVPGIVSEVGHGVALALPWQNDGPCTAAGICPESAAILAALPKAADTDARAGSGRSTVGTGRNAWIMAWISANIFSEAATRRSMPCSHADCGPVVPRALATTACNSGVSSKFCLTEHWVGGRPNETDGGERSEPGGGDTSDTGGGDTNEPSGGEASEPGGGDTNDDETVGPSDGDTNEPGSGEASEPGGSKTNDDTVGPSDGDTNDETVEPSVGETNDDETCGPSDGDTNELGGWGASSDVAVRERVCRVNDSRRSGRPRRPRGIYKFNSTANTKAQD